MKKKLKNSEEKKKSTAKVDEKKSSKKKDRSGLPTDEEVVATIGKNRSFAMAEAHKRLRTNLMFSFADEEECHVIGVTSAMAHEGKSTTSINLAYDLTKAGKKTLFIDADMRLSKVAKYLEVERSPGLSNMLVGKGSGQAVVQQSATQDGLHIITCGDIPPNPTELLASKRFGLILDALREEYEYIIIDLPPIVEVADALIASQLADGMIVVVRQNYADKRLLDDSINQLSLTGAKILGLVMTCVEHATKYGKYKYKKYSSKKYHYHSGYGKYYGYQHRGYHSHYNHGYGYNSPYSQNNYTDDNSRSKESRDE